MKFLSKAADDALLMPLNFQYVDDGKEDTLYVTYKDIRTKEKYVEVIESPKIVIWTVKPEYRGNEDIAPANRIRDFIEEKYLDKHLVRYKYRKYEASKLLHIPKENIMRSPYVLGLDTRIEHFYFMEFRKEYGNDAIKPITIAFADIEAEIKYAPYTGMAPYGSVPISLITLIDTANMVSWTFMLYNKDYAGIDELWDNIESFKKDLNDSFDAAYGHIQYNFCMYESEIDLLTDFWKVVRMVSPDFLETWNMPFDMGHIIERIRTLGYIPEEIICDTEHGFKPFLQFREDTSIKAHKRRHVCELPIPTVVSCQLRNYAVIRAAGATIPDFRLNTIADIELEDKKVEYKDEYSIKDFPYEDYPKYVKYNIKDVLLEVGIEAKTHDTDDIYGRMYDFAVLQSDVNATVQIVTNHYREELASEELGHKIMCHNKNKIDMVDIYELVKSMDDDNDTEDMLDIVEDIRDEEVLVDENGNKKKFDGAIVMDPNRMNSSGFGTFKFIHNNTIDEDIGAEYPTSTEIMNASNETFIGRVAFKGDFEMPMYNYKFLTDEETKLYKNNPAAVALETFAYEDVLVGAELFLGLPSPEKVMKSLDLSKIVKKRKW